MLEDFFSYGSECTADDLCDALDAMNELWGRILYDSRRHMLVMSSEDDEVTRLTLRYLAPFAKARRVRCGFILVASDRRIGEMARRYATAPYRIEYCDRDIIEKLGRVLSVSTYSSILSFNSLDLTTDNDAYELVRRGLLSKEEVLALACLQLDYVPDERETDESRKEFERTFPGEDAIDWKLYPPAPYRGSTTDIFERILENPGIGKDDQVFISGAVRSSIMLAERMHNFNIFGIIDNNKAKQGTEYEGLMVYAPEELDEKFGRDIRIIVHTRHFREICEQLSRLGYEMGKQVFPAYVADDPYFRTEMLKSSIRCIYKSGKAVYDRVRERCPDELLIHLPYSGTGDAYLAGMYMEDMIRIHHLPDSIFIVRSEACRKILGLFGYESEVLDEAGSDSLIKYARIVGFKTANYIMLNDSYDFRTSIRLRGINGIDFHTMFQISVFKVPEKRRIPVG
ncbi:MAG: hypothetical protein IJM62_06845, partial [Lachnospiraceae bacterium]|nr:hypothetical protein [Lachnospiraceae bacterium]